MTPRDPRVVAMAINLYHHNVRPADWFLAWHQRRFPADPLPVLEVQVEWEGRFRRGFGPLAAHFDHISFEAHLEVVLEMYGDESGARIETWDRMGPPRKDTL